MAAYVPLPGFVVSPLPTAIFGSTLPGQPSGILLQFPPFPFLPIQGAPSGLTII